VNPRSIYSLATLTELPGLSKRTTLVLVLLTTLAGLASPSSARDKIVVLPFEIVRGIETATPEKHAEEEQRLLAAADLLRQKLRIWDRFDVVDSLPIAKKAASVNLQACGNCGDDLAREVGARYVALGEVRKVSELILSMHVYIRDAENAQLLAVASVDLRGNTQESWRRALDYLWQNVLISRLQTAIRRRG
jgi:Protein of unknown function (DUF2380)